MARTKEQIREYSKKYYHEHREEIIEQAKKWRKEHPERVLELSRKYRRENPEKFREAARIRRKKYPNKIREFKRISERKVKLEVLSHYSNGKLECAHCEEKRFELLSIDHTFTEEELNIAGSLKIMAEFIFIVG